MGAKSPRLGSSGTNLADQEKRLLKKSLATAPPAAARRQTTNNNQLLQGKECHFFFKANGTFLSPMKAHGLISAVADPTNFKQFTNSFFFLNNFKHAAAAACTIAALCLSTSAGLTGAGAVPGTGSRSAVPSGPRHHHTECSARRARAVRPADPQRHHPGSPELQGLCMCVYSTRLAMHPSSDFARALGPAAT